MIDPWEKAAECEQAARAATDPERWAVLTHLRDLWITLANETCFMSAEERAQEIEAVGRLHARIAAPIQSLQ